MNRRKKITLFFGIELEHFGKDVALVPYYIGKTLNMDVQIVYTTTPTNKNLHKLNMRDLMGEERQITLTPLPNPLRKNRKDFIREFAYCIYLLFNAKKIDILMRFHFSPATVVIGYLYKKLNPRGVLYVKADGGDIKSPIPHYKKLLFLKRFKKFKNVVWYNIYYNFFQSINLITVETNAGYNNICGDKFWDIDFKSKTRLMPNGFDEDLFKRFNMSVKSFEQKENLIITVGRLGADQKNTEMLLNAAKKLSFNNWKIALIGSLETSERNFQDYVDNFFTGNPGLKNNVVFTGPVYNKKKLWEWYNRAKVFLLTSRWESWGLVLNEACRFNNYIISTDVGGAAKIISVQSNYGELIPQEDPNYLAKSLQEIIDNSNKIAGKYMTVDWDNIDISWETYVACIAKELYYE